MQVPQARNGQPAPLLLWPTTGQPTLKGEVQATSSRNRSSLSALPVSGILHGPDSWLCLYSLVIALWPAGQVSLLGRQDTDCTDSQSTLFFYQIYSPDPATSMEHSRSDLLSSIPSLPSGTLGPIVTASPQAQPSLGGRPGLLRMRLPGSHLRGWLSTQGCQAGKNTPAGQDTHTLPTQLQRLANPSLKWLSCLE